MSLTVQAIAPAALLVAAALALAFHRNRALQVLLLLLLAALALIDGSSRQIEGALRFVPLLLVVCALLPEPRLLSRRHLVLLAVICVISGVTLLGPEHVFRGFVGVAAAMVLSLPAPRGAALLAAIAAGLCLMRWAFTGRPMEFGLVLVLACATLAFGFAGSSSAQWWFTACAGVGVLSVLYSSYRMAFIDPLSGLPNRRALDETLMRLSGRYALAMVDVDHFKQFNDSYGHDAGDLVLQAVARGLRRQRGAAAYRYGGEEFCLVFQGSRARGAAAVCEAAREAIQILRIAVPAPSPKRGKIEAIKRPMTSVSVTVSIGLAKRGEGRRNVSEVLKAADQALYRAKGKGRNRVIEA